MLRVCIIGAGIMGTSLMYHLSLLPKIHVTVVDSGYPGTGVTAAGTGWINGRGVLNPDYRQLKVESMNEHIRLSAHFPGSPWLSTGGVLQTESSVPDLDALVQECIEHNYPVDVLDTQSARSQMEPNVAFDSSESRLLYFPTEFTINGPALTKTLFDSALDNGGIGHFGSSVSRIEQISSARHRVILADGAWIDADVVVNAAGPSADKVARMYGLDLHMKPQPGIGIKLAVQGLPLRRLLITKHFSIKPEAAGSLRVRTRLGWRTKDGIVDPDASFTGAMEMNDYVDSTVSRVRELLPDIGHIRAVQTMTGVRPIPANGLPSVGEVEGTAGYYEMVTHSGANLGPLLGRLLAAEIATGSRDETLAAYCPTYASSSFSPEARTHRSEDEASLTGQH